MSSNKFNNGALGSSIGSTSLRGDEEDPNLPNRKLVSDALAKNSRQLLYAHLYNYLMENQLYDTARILLQEADVPISGPKDLNDNGTPGSRSKNIGEDEELPGVKMLMTSPDTFLLEWWQSLWALHSHVRDTNAMAQQRMSFQGFPGAGTGAMPGLPNGMVPPQGLSYDAYNRMVSQGQQMQQMQQMQPQLQHQQQQHQQQPQQPLSQQQQSQSQQPNSAGSHSISPADNISSSPAIHNGKIQMGSQPPQSLQSPLPQSAHGTPHSGGLTAPSPAMAMNQQAHQGSALMPQRPTPLVQQQPAGPVPQRGPSQGQPQIPQQSSAQHHQQQSGAQQHQQQQHQQGHAQFVRQQHPGMQHPQLAQQHPQQQTQPGQQQHQPQQTQQPSQPWPTNKAQQLELQQRVQLQKAHLNNQLQNFSNLPPQQQLLVQHQQQRLQQQAQAMAHNRMMGQPPQPPQPPQPQAGQPQSQLQQQQQHPSQPPPQQPQAGQHPPQQQQQQQQQQQPGQFVPMVQQGQMMQGMHPPKPQLPYGNGTNPAQRRENNAALHDYQMQLMMLENQTKMNGPPASHTPTIENGQRSRGESIAIDPLQPDPMQLMELFPGETRGSVGGLDELVGFNGDLNMMNGF